MRHSDKHSSLSKLLQKYVCTIFLVLAPEKSNVYSTLGYVPGLKHKYKVRQEKLVRDKPSRLNGTNENYGHKKFYNICPRI
jgi:hypothetical protein